MTRGYIITFDVKDEFGNEWELNPFTINAVSLDDVLYKLQNFHSFEYKSIDHSNWKVVNINMKEIDIVEIHV